MSLRGLADVALPETSCPQAACLLESLDAAGLSLQCPGGGDDGAPVPDDAP